MRTTSLATLTLALAALSSCGGDTTPPTAQAPTPAADTKAAPGQTGKASASAEAQPAPVANAKPTAAATTKPVETTPAEAKPAETKPVETAAAAPTATASAAGAKDGVAIPQAAEAIAIDGDARDWADIPALPVPFQKKAAGSVKLAWRADGLYGLIQVKDKSIDIDEHSPWSADTIELWLDPTGKRPDEMEDSSQIALSPNPLQGKGECVVVVAQGQIDANAIKRSWAQTADGYILEFCIPAAEMVPAKLQSGAKLGFNYAIDDDGKAIEEFFADKDTNEAYHNPQEWGLITLK